MEADRSSVLVTPVAPGDSGYGLRMRAGLLYRALARLGDVRVVVVPVHGSRYEASDLCPPDRLTVVDLNGAANLRADLVARVAEPLKRARLVALHPRPSLSEAATIDVAQSVAGLIGGAPLVLVMREYLAPYLDAVLDHRPRPICILDVDDVESTVRRRSGEPAEAERYESLEHHYLPRFDHILACSPRDAADLRHRYGIDAMVVPNAVIIPALRPIVPRWDVLFVANFSYAPNVVAARWLCDEVLPLMPKATVALVGLNPSAEVDSLRAENVFVSGPVSDVEPYYAASRLVVVPLQTGGGTSIKVLEAFAHRRPVVSTATGVRGLPVADGKHVLIADEPQSFADACVRLLDDCSPANRMSDAAYSLVEDQFATKRVTASLAAVLRYVTSNRGQ